MSSHETRLKPDFTIWLAPWAGRMNQILRCYWLNERSRWRYLARRSGLPAMSQKKNFLESHIINPLLTKLVRSRWLDIDLVLFFNEFMDRDGVEVHNHAKKKLGQYPATLTSPLVNKGFIIWKKEHYFLTRHSGLSRVVKIAPSCPLG